MDLQHSSALPTGWHSGLSSGQRSGLHFGIRAGLHFGIRAGLLLSALLCSGSALAQQKTEQRSTELTLVLAQSCQFSGNNGASFGTLDFGSFSLLTAPRFANSQLGAGSIQLQCNAGVNFKILINQGLHGSSVNSRQLKDLQRGGTLDYQLYRDPQRSQIWDDNTGLSAVATGLLQQFNVYATLPAQPVPASGQYSDTLTVTVSW